MKNVQLTQLSIAQSEKDKPISLAFTGHRTLDKDFSVRRLRKELKKQIEKGVYIFYNGMAIGFDLIAAETVLKLKARYPHIRFIACVPCYGQEKNFSETDQKRYARILKKADETAVLSSSYFRGCMQQRNRYMADRADVLMAYCNADTGGTAYTVKYFQKTKPVNEIIFI